MLYDQYGTPIELGQKIALALKYHIAVGEVVEIVETAGFVQVFIETTYPSGDKRKDIATFYRRDGDKRCMTEILVLGE